MSHGGNYKSWYSGITNDPQDRRIQHNIAVNDPTWFYYDAGSEAAARNMEDRFHNLGCDGAPGGGDGSSRYVYVYKKNSSSNP